VSAEWWVRVPASTSNLGPGFDVLGMAVDVFLEARYHVVPHPLELHRTGTLSAVEGPPDDDLLVQALVETVGGKPLQGRGLRGEGGDGPAGREVGLHGVLHVHSDIPVGRGLGSSAAAVVAGHILGLLSLGRAVDRRRVVEWVTRREGHPDNAAPAVLGGLVAARVSEGHAVSWIPHSVSDRLAWVYAAPEAPLDTAAARAVIPDTVPTEVAVRTAARVACLLPALARGEGAVLAEAMEDEIHVPHRLPLVPGGRAAVAAGTAAGAWAVTLSGAGSGVIAVCPPEDADRVGDAMARAFRAAPGSGGGFFRVLRPWSEGTVWGEGTPAADSAGGPAS
jgi:homoserine kinase